MPARILSAALVGLESKIVEVEADISSGLPNFMIVGLPDIAVQEAKVRVRSAIKNSGLSFPYTRVAVNLAPCDLKKEGPSYDLPIALGIHLAYEGVIPEISLDSSIFIGELSLDGHLRKINGVLSIAMMAQRNGIKNIFLPEENAQEASIISGLNIFPLKTFSQLIKILNKEESITPFKSNPAYFEREDDLDETFSLVKGQEYAKRALEIVAAGGHNLFMVGPPGTGKTFLARSIISILPSLETSEMLEVTRIYSVAGMVAAHKPLIQNRPFRNPHHSSSAAALIGGGRFPKPGEISLSHRGVLFLDELPEFPRAVLESLRQPLEDGVVTVSRVAGSIQFPARFILIAAANPCPCGFLSDPKQVCRCTPHQVLRYQKRISGPLLDRMDLQVEVPRLDFAKLTQENVSREEIARIKDKIKRARQIQTARLLGKGMLENSEMNHKEISQFCAVDSEGKAILKKAVEQIPLSARAYYRVLKVARTIADLDQEEKLKTNHLAEAIQYRIKQMGD
ncbi:MAG: magnesium chelatase [Candidatus Kerfeldbacteria bacterium CG_4_10_14_0_8_um_filter_42_10]|uniref:Magnesium chelatase n=1 Tax=Candidatus Kerfeldbacteria bacterium CG_4_10_14_0_8_um_filter_42_10 TaxID=2014248 RepID=A0A2M7RJZ0_9BACT|nr:MAG: magnesium chelatase [Candidatus Kerfeldbacteria bacterium CG_4_10_14_0_8_um_filter_42_10]